jgi:hypothetical protein
VEGGYCGDVAGYSTYYAHVDEVLHGGSLKFRPVDCPSFEYDVSQQHSMGVA